MAPVVEPDGPRAAVGDGDAPVGKSAGTDDAKELVLTPTVGRPDAHRGSWRHIPERAVARGRVVVYDDDAGAVQDRDFAGALTTRRATDGERQEGDRASSPLPTRV